MLSNIKINNFKSIIAENVPLYGHGLYVFTGKNGVGKSSLLLAISSYYLESDRGIDGKEVKYVEYNNLNNTRDIPVYVEFSHAIDSSLKKNSSYSLKSYDGHLFSLSGEIVDLINEGVSSVSKVRVLRRDNSLSKDFCVDFDSREKIIDLKKGLKISTEVDDMIRHEYSTLNGSKLSNKKDLSDFDYLLKSLCSDVLIDKVRDSYKWNDSDDCLFKLTIEEDSKDKIIQNVIDLNDQSKDRSNYNKYLFSLLDGCNIEDKRVYLKSHLQNDNLKERLSREISLKLNNFIKEKLTKVDVEVSFKISDDNMLSLSLYINKIKVNFNDLSDGLKHILSLVFSQALSTKENIDYNNIIVIDEPENSLHPSAIKEMRKIILEMSKNNYVFIATHSPFMIDYEQDAGHNVHYYEVTNNGEEGTKARKLEEDESFHDNKLFESAFGLSFMSELLASDILVLEGISDVVVIKDCLKNKHVKIINGKGSKLKQLVEFSKNSNIIGIFDDDDAGRNSYVKRCEELSVSYKVKGFTYKTLLSSLKKDSELEDLYDIDYVKNYLEFLNKDLELSESFNYEDKVVNKNIDTLLSCYNRSCIGEDKDAYKKLIDHFKIDHNLDNGNKIKVLISDKIKEELSNFFAAELKKDKSEYDLSKIRSVAGEIDQLFNY